MRVGILATMGSSPPVVSELVDYFYNNNLSVSKLVILSTKEVLSNSWFACAAVKSRFRNMLVDVLELSMNDVDSEENMYKFMDNVVDAFSRLRGYHVYLNVAGGRKEMGIILTMIGSLIGVSGIYHVIAKDVKLWNMRLEQLRNDIKIFGNTSLSLNDKVDLYLKKKDIYDKTMYPPPNEYNILNIPIIPYPRETLEFIINILNNQNTTKPPTNDILTKLKTANLIQISKTKIKPTKHGIKLGEWLNKLHKSLKL
jgi:CRISPR-associated protein Csx14